MTPRPWINVISNGRYGLMISQAGGGFSWLEDANLNRLTRWYQDLVLDNWGKFFYLRDEDSGDFWSVTYRPTLVELKDFACRHGVGYTIFHSSRNHIRSELRVFVPFDNDLEIWTLRLTNSGSVPRRLGVYTYLEWCLGTANDSHREFHKLFIETGFDDEKQALLARKRLWDVPSERGHWNTSWPWLAFFACSEAVDGYEGDKANFIGNGSDLACPRVVRSGKATGTVGKWGDAIASVQKLVRLRPGETRELHFFLGAAENESEIHSLLDEYRKPGQVETAFQGTLSRWRELLCKTWVRTPDDGLNLLANIWLKYQAISGRLWGRAGNYQQSGAYGFRDQLQDSQIFLYLDPEQTRRQIKLHAAHQFTDGHVLHWWHNLTEQGYDSQASDDLLWLTFVTIAYIKETADFAFLEERVRFYKSGEEATVLEHCLRAVDLALNRLSDRKLPRILSGDWNDGLNALGGQGKGESVWLAHFLIYLLRELKELLGRLGMQEQSQRYGEAAYELEVAVNRYGWDGRWYLRAIKPTGQPIGGAQDDGRIYLNPQTWAILARSAESRRLRTVFRAILERLECRVGPRLLAPAYQSPDPEIGYLTRYAPGVRENGGVYVHAATWAIWAACTLGEAGVAYRFYREISPLENGLDPDRYQAEPYVTAGHIHGPDSPYYGRGAWTWYTGSAAWLVRVIIDFLLGVRADYDGLLVDPCYPPEWGQVKLVRFFRNCSYRITLSHTEELNPGELRMEIDGTEVAGNVIPVTRTAEKEVMVRWRQGGKFGS